LKFIQKIKFLFLFNFSFAENTNYTPEILEKEILSNYNKENLECIDIYKENNFITVIYENIASINIYNKYAWYGNIIYESDFKNGLFNYIFLFKNHNPADNVSKLVINSETQLDVLYSYNPVVVYEKNNTLMTFVYILKNQDIVYITVDKSFSIETHQKTKISKKIYKYYIKNIKIKNFKNILNTIKYINNYSIGTKISNNVLENIKNVSVVVDINNTKNKYYYIYFALPHDYTECNKPHIIEDSQNILYILVINNDNIIENIIYKPYCCLGK
jgi:hypothetical protein